MLGHFFKVQSIDLTFTDFKCLGRTCPGTHGGILENNNSDPEVAKELKMPWVEQPRLITSPTTRNHKGDLLNPGHYMRDLQYMYRFLSTYERTMFLS